MSIYDLDPLNYDPALLVDLARVCNERLQAEIGPEAPEFHPASPLICLTAEYAHQFCETKEVPTPELVAERTGIVDPEPLEMAEMFWAAYCEAVTELN